MSVFFLFIALPGSAHALGPLSSFGAYGNGAGQMTNAGGVAIAQDGTAYIADTGNNQIDVFSPAGAFVRSFGKVVIPSDGCEQDEGCQTADGRGSAGALSQPRDLVVDSAGNVFVADTGNLRVDVFSPEGVFLRAFGMNVNPLGKDPSSANVCTEATGCQRGSPGGGAAALSSPTGIGIDSAGTIYVTDSGNHFVDAYSPAGAYIRSYGKEVSSGGGSGNTDDENEQNNSGREKAGAMNRPYDVAINSAGQVAVSDLSNHRVDVFAADGTFLRAFGKEVAPASDVCTIAGCQKGKESGLAGALPSPSAIAVSASGNLYVADTANNRINEFSFDGAFIRAFGVGVVDGAAAFQACTAATGCKAGISSTIPGAVLSPRGVAVDCGGAIYAVEHRSPVQSDQEGGQGQTPTPGFARVERFGEPGAAAPPCPPPAGSSSPFADSSPTSPPKARPGVMKPEIQIELNGGSGTATLTVVVANLGTLWLRGKGIRSVKRVVKRIGLVELPIVPKGAVRKKLEKVGKATVKVLLTFKPDKGESSTQAKSLTLKMVSGF